MLDYVSDQLAVLKLDETMQPILEIDSDGNQLSVIISDQLFFEPNRRPR